MHFLHPVVDVSTQGSCTITPLNPTTLTATGGVLPIGTMNVMIQCNCTKDTGTVVDSVRWYDPASNRLVRPDNIDKFDASAPHFTKVDGSDTNVILVIPTFNDSFDGTYTCGKRVKRGLPGPPNAAVILAIEGQLSVQYVFCFYVYNNMVCVHYIY